MTNEERIEQLQGEIKELKSILQEVLAGPYTEGVIEGGPSQNGFYRVVNDGGTPMIMPPDPEKKIPPTNLKEGTKVIINKLFICDILPEELTKKVPPVEFTRITWDQIGGLSSQVEKIRKDIELPMTQQSLFTKYNLKPSRGVLLWGPPGCGKTLVAKAIASHFLKDDVISTDSFIYLKGAELLSKWVGQTENAIRSIFDRARKHYKTTGTRCVIFIDEAEALLPIRGSRHSSDVETTIVPTFISEMDGFEDNNTYVILATNHPEALDPAIIRPGRIDLKVAINKPSQQECAEIFEVHLKKTIVSGDITTIAAKSAEVLFKSPVRDQATGALVANIVENATLKAIERSMESKKHQGVTLDDVLLAIPNAC